MGLMSYCRNMFQVSAFEQTSAGSKDPGYAA